MQNQIGGDSTVQQLSAYAQSSETKRRFVNGKKTSFCFWFKIQTIIDI